MRKRMAALLTALMVVLAAWTPAQPAGAAASTETLRVWQWNVAGNAKHKGSTTNGLVNAIVSAILDKNVDFVALNELCWSQYKAIQSRLAEEGWPQTSNYSRFGAAIAHVSTACGEYGNAIFSKQPLGTATVKALAVEPLDNGERRNLLCAPVQNKKLRFCATHITPYPTKYPAPRDTNMIQLNEVREQLEDWDNAGETVLIAGDFNRQPDWEHLNPWYSSSVNTVNNAGNTGRYRELDDADPVCLGYGEGTTDDLTDGKCQKGSKIDMIFAPESKIVGGYFADTLGISVQCGGVCSDHRIIWGQVTVSVG